MKGFIMNREKVSSSNIESIGYDESSETLEIEFKDSGIYEYSNVPESEYEALISASSIGGYFHKNIKGKFSSHKTN